jgi:PAS domain S-box-containing protein
MESRRKDIKLPSQELSVELLLDSVVDYAIYMLDVDGYITSWNTGAERIKGYGVNDALGLHFSEFFTREDKAAGKPMVGLDIAARTGRFEEEGWRVRKDGTQFWALTALDAIYDKEGGLLGFAKVTRDMSERHAAQQALLESESRFRLLVEAVSDYAIFMLDTNGNITNWNRGAERIKGYLAHEVIGRHFSMFYTAEEQEEGKPQQALARALAEGRFTSEGIRVRKDGTRFWANIALQPIRDESDRIIGFAKVTRDISEQRKAEAALEAAREELHQAQKMEALGHLTGGVAHDFNNFLTAIIGNLENVKAKTELDSAATRQVDAALQAAHNGSQVVRQMLVFARKAATQLVTTDVNQAVEEISSLVRRSAQENIELVLDLSDRLNPAKTDPVQLQTCVLNLTLNALDAMPQGGTLTICTENVQVGEHERLQPGDYVCITVSDTGAGMTPEVQAHAFEPFFTTKALGKGTGLGLSMVYGAVQQLDGDVQLESEPGKGTSVKLLFPIAQAEDHYAEPEPEPVIGPPPPAVDAPAERHLDVLYVEDDFLVGLATIETLEKAGIEVRSAARAEEALELLDRHPEIDVLLTDIGLPGMSGHELVAEARRRVPGLKVLFLTGYDRTGPIMGTEADAVTQYMDKPYQPENLLRTIRALAATPSER